MAIIKRVAYAYNSALVDAGEAGYFFDAIVIVDGELMVDCHASYKSREELYAAMETVIPALEEVNAVEEGDPVNGKEVNS